MEYKVFWKNRKVAEFKSYFECNEYVNSQLKVDKELIASDFEICKGVQYNSLEFKLIDFMEFIAEYGFDITDNYWDWGCYFETPRKLECKDFYDKCMLYFAENITIIKYAKDWYSTCLISDFIMENLEAFNQFMNEENADDYKPINFEPIESIEDDLMIDIYIATFESLICGNYSEKDYEKLYKYLTKNKRQQSKKLVEGF